MRSFAPLIALTFGLLATTASAQGAASVGLQYVSETSIEGANGPLSLCHRVDQKQILSVPIYTRLPGYAVSADACTGGEFRALTAQDVASLQAEGLIPASLPITPKASLQDTLVGHTGFILGGLGLLALIGAALRLRPRGKSRSKDMLAIHSLVAMSQVAIADGRIEDGEVRNIANILTRLTGTAYAPAQVMDMLSQLNPSASDLAEVGQDLSDKDREIVLEAALNIAVADGDIHPNEYAVVSELAQRMRIGADQFRAAMARISAHLQTVQPTS